MKPFFYQFTVSVKKCGGSRNTIDNTYAQTCVPYKVKNMALKLIT